MFRREFFLFKFVIFEIRILPLLHTTLVKVICAYKNNEAPSKAVPVNSAVEDLRERILFRNEYVF